MKVYGYPHTCDEWKVYRVLKRIAPQFNITEIRFRYNINSYLYDIFFMIDNDRYYLIEVDGKKHFDRKLQGKLLRDIEQTFKAGKKGYKIIRIDYISAKGNLESLIKEGIRTSSNSMESKYFFSDFYLYKHIYDFLR